MDVRIFALSALALMASGCGGGGGSSTQTSPMSTSPPATQSTPSASTTIWVPTTSDTFQWQLSGTLDASVPASIYDLDAFETTPAAVASLHAVGRHVVCYVNAGAYEKGRPDASAFPAVVIGAPYAGYPNEAWLDIRQIAILGPIMDARLDICRSKGFDAVEPDNINGWENPTGFPLQAQDQIAYNTWFAQHAHARGMSVSLKNDGDQSAQLLGSFDFVIAESCWNQSLCTTYAPFVQAKKAVFTVEYTDLTTSAGFQQTVCPQARTAQMTALLKHRNLDAYRDICP